ncbi:hypothetical protein SO802_018168 [Lithocarpus litseifolius]|uniref:Uncharacterized protein n=1 Tax=Lithocarpus litseifolius TaxID=425828 RepID=A0AAW2CPV8_9ROSI
MCPKHEQNDIRSINFLTKSVRDILPSLLYKIHIVLPIPCLAAKELRKSKKIGFTLTSPKSSSFSTDIAQLNSPSKNYSSKWKRCELQIQVGEMSASPDGKPIIFFTHDKQAL